jgi:UDP-3-O-[3-hydroxymyristoyl] glucosamine N-acyltransferase
LFSGATIYFDCVIGNNVIIHSGAVIGSDGFGFAPNPDGTYTKIAQIGNVVIGDDVEMGANTAIDRATMGSTLIGKGVKIDNLVQIAHNVESWRAYGYCRSGGYIRQYKNWQKRRCWRPGGYFRSFKYCRAHRYQAQTGINSSITEEGMVWGGTPYMPYKDYLKAHLN